MTLTLGILGGLTMFMLFGDSGYADMKEMVRMKAHLVERNRALMEKNLALYEVIDRLRHDPDYVAYVARKELGLVGQEDIVYGFTPVRREN